MLTGPANLDLQTKTLTDMLSRGQWAPHEIGTIERQVQRRKEQVAAGLANPTAVWWTIKLQKLDPMLRMRWEKSCCTEWEMAGRHKVDCGGEIGWCIDRWVEEFGCWMPIGVLGRNQIRPDLIEYLKSRDMQAVGADEWLEIKRAEAEAVRKHNEYVGDQKVAAAVDSLPREHIKNFIEVEDAMRRGDTNIVARGEMKESLERMEAASKKAQTGDNPGDEACVNPGHRLDRRA